MKKHTINAVLQLNKAEQQEIIAKYFDEIVENAEIMLNSPELSNAIKIEL